VQQFDPLTLHVRQPLQPEPLGGPLKRPDRHIHAHDAGELPLLEQVTQQCAFTTPKIEHARHAARLERRHHRAHPLSVEAEWLLDLFFFSVVLLLRRIWVEVVFDCEPSKGIAGQSVLVLQVATCYEVLLRMTRQPRFTAGE